AASMAPMRPRVSTIPRAIIWTSAIAVLLCWVPDGLVTAVVLSGRACWAGAGGSGAGGSGAGGSWAWGSCACCSLALAAGALLAACAATGFFALGLRGGGAGPASPLGTGSSVMTSLLHLL